MILVTVIIFLTSPLFTTAGADEKLVQKTQNLAISSCIKYDEDFCSRQVENSVCNRIKDECFCRKGFVAIRENGRVTCKTLLTDLKCRVDRDCIHVNRSSCHPGAGYCSCPGSTIYVPQHHACRSRYLFYGDPVCNVCRQNGGICYRYEDYDTIDEFEGDLNDHNNVVSNRLSIDMNSCNNCINTNRIGCACPDNGLPAKGQPGNPLQHICSGKLVDVESVCDERKFFCRSKNAVCRSFYNLHMEASSVRIYSSQPHSWSNDPARLPNDMDTKSQVTRVCQCKRSSVAVYQNTLEYTECFPTLPATSKRCAKCVNSGGQCYDINDDNIGDGCTCPPNYSASSLSKVSTTVQGKENAEPFCDIQHSFVSCSDGYLNVCYYPHWHSPYTDLMNDLLNFRSRVQLASSSYIDENQYDLEPKSELDQSKPTLIQSSNAVDEKTTKLCTLKLKNGSTKFNGQLSLTVMQNTINKQIRPFCLSLDVWTNIDICAVRKYILDSNTVQFEGILEVLVNQSIRTPSRDIRIPLTCIAKRPERPLKVMNSYDDLRADVSAFRQLNIPKVNLRILNEQNKEISITRIGEKIHLDALLFDSAGLYKHVVTESCYLSNRSVDWNSNSMDNYIQWIRKGCSIQKHLIPSELINSDLHNEQLFTDAFPAFRLGNLASVFFTCIFKVCKQAKLCEQPKCQDTNNPRWSANKNVTNEDKFINTLGKRANGTNNHLTDWNLLNEISHNSDIIIVRSQAQIEVNFVQNTEISAHPSDSSCLVRNVQSADINSASSLSSKTNRPVCHFAVCLTTLHLSWIVLGLIVVLIIFILSLILIYRKYKFMFSKQSLLNSMKQSDVNMDQCAENPQNLYWKERNNRYHPNLLPVLETKYDSSMTPSPYELTHPCCINTLSKSSNYPDRSGADTNVAYCMSPQPSSKFLYLFENMNQSTTQFGCKEHDNIMQRTLSSPESAYSNSSGCKCQTLQPKRMKRTNILTNPRDLSSRHHDLLSKPNPTTTANPDAESEKLIENETDYGHSYTEFCQYRDSQQANSSSPNQNDFVQRTGKEHSTFHGCDIRPNPSYDVIHPNTKTNTEPDQLILFNNRPDISCLVLDNCQTSETDT